MDQKSKDVLRETDDEAVRLARGLLRKARHAALAVIDPASGAPFTSRVAIATDFDGSPVILISSLATHTGGLLADPRCSILVGETGKGDPLAHPRMTVICRAEKIEKTDPRHGRIEWRFLSRNPKSKLYAGFADFAYFLLAPQSASLNGGFGKAYALTPDHLLCRNAGLEALAGAERSAVTHMNEDHDDAIRRYARHYAKADGDLDWKMTGIDPDGFDLIAGDHILRIPFDAPLNEPKDMHHKLVAMAIEARKAEASPESDPTPAT